MSKWYKKIDFSMLILIIILVGVLTCFLQLKLFGKDHIEFFGYTVFRVITGSMSNVIEPEDIVIVKLTKDVEKNDIITYRSGSDFITHRIIEMDNNKIITKGDANNSEDEPIELDVVVGKVVFIFNHVGVWINVVKSPQVIIAVAISIIAIKFLFFNNKNKLKEEQ